MLIFDLTKKEPGFFNPGSYLYIKSEVNIYFYFTRA